MSYVQRFGAFGRVKRLLVSYMPLARLRSGLACGVRSSGREGRPQKSRDGTLRAEAAHARRSYTPSEDAHPALGPPEARATTQRHAQLHAAAAIT